MIQEQLKSERLIDLDETAWLDQTARLVHEGRWREIDSDSLSEYLSDMARRERREVVSRMVTLITHILKWEYQPDKRSASWRETIFDQQFELNLILESGSLAQHADEEFEVVYSKARNRASRETNLPESVFPLSSQFTLDEWLSFNPTEEVA